jgi:hypothetical protein
MQVRVDHRLQKRHYQAALHHERMVGFQRVNY